jgi:hypothetical protein
VSEEANKTTLKFNELSLITEHGRHNKNGSPKKKIKIKIKKRRAET